MTHTVGWPEINISFQVKKCVEINKIQLNRANARSTKKTQAEKKKKNETGYWWRKISYILFKKLYYIWEIK